MTQAKQRIISLRMSLPTLEINGEQMLQIAPGDVIAPAVLDKAIDEWLDRFSKVSVYSGGPMHIDDPERVGQITLCGHQWYFHSDLGDTYCRNCQRVLAARKRARIDAESVRLDKALTLITSKAFGGGE